MQNDRVAPGVVLTTATLGVVELILQQRDPTMFWVFALLAGIPTAGVALVATLLARRRSPAAGVVFLTTFASHAALAFALFPGRWREVAVMAALACTGIGFATALPFLAACALVRDARRLLAIGMGWCAACQIAMAALGWADIGPAICGAILAAAVAVHALIRKRRSP